MADPYEDGSKKTKRHDVVQILFVTLFSWISKLVPSVSSKKTFFNKKVNKNLRKWEPRTNQIYSDVATQNNFNFEFTTMHKYENQSGWDAYATATFQFDLSYTQHMGHQP